MNAYRVVGAISGAALAVLAVEVAMVGCSGPRYSPDVLEDAIERGDEAEVRRCLANGVSVNCRFRTYSPMLRFTPLQVAAREGHLGIMELLIKGGAEVNAADGQGQTPLITVAGANDLTPGRLECFKHLLVRGADPVKRDIMGWTALFHAASQGHAEYVKLLISAGVDVNQEDEGATALHYACSFARIREGQLAVVRVLLDAGADGTKRDKYGSTPVDVARRENRVELLREFAARGLIPKDSIPEEKPKIPEEKAK